MSLTDLITLIEHDQLFICKALQGLEVPNPICFFENGQQALSYLETTLEQPFLILYAIMNGIELHQRINANDYLRYKAILFILLTTAANQRLSAVSMRPPFRAFIRNLSIILCLVSRSNSLLTISNIVCIRTVR